MQRQAGALAIMVSSQQDTDWTDLSSVLVQLSILNCVIMFERLGDIVTTGEKFQSEAEEPPVKFINIHKSSCIFDIHCLYMTQLHDLIH